MAIGLGGGLNFLLETLSLFLGAHLVNSQDTSFLTFYRGLGFSGTGK